MKPHRDNRIVLVGLLIVCAILLWDRQQLRRQLGHQVQAESAALAEVAAPLTQALTRAKARELARFYAAFEDVLQRDSDTVTSTGLFRRAHGRALALAFQDTPTAGEPQVGPLVDAVFFAALGKNDRALGKDDRAKLFQAMRAIAKACEGVR